MAGEIARPVLIDANVVGKRKRVERLAADPTHVEENAKITVELVGCRARGASPDRNGQVIGTESLTGSAIGIRGERSANDARAESTWANRSSKLRCSRTRNRLRCSDCP